VRSRWGSSSWKCLPWAPSPYDIPSPGDCDAHLETTPSFGIAKNSAISIGDVGTATLCAYPRLWSTIWDWVVRAVAVALTGREELPPRPQPLDVPVHDAGGISYVRLREIPEPAASLSRKRIEFSTRPLVEQDPQPMDCVRVRLGLARFHGRAQVALSRRGDSARFLVKQMRYPP